ncbi:unnamed protein product [Schistosoma mattheei]|uniref:Uncharacterized protein n=1 Tax=Schistosoma mattheei TaxID=31246 RepID=A0A183NES4_9TREM|nr:unnamed protein product [Schistosoma mattheei]
MKGSCKGLARVGPSRLPDWGPRDGATQDTLYDQVTPRPNVWKSNISVIQECAAKTDWFVDTSLSLEEAWSVFRVPRRPNNSPPWITKPVRKLLRRKKHRNMISSTGLEQYRSSY